MFDKFNKEKLDERDTITLGLRGKEKTLKWIMEKMIRFAHKKYVDKNCIIKHITDIRDTDKLYYMTYYYKALNDVLNNNGRYNFDDDHPNRLMIDLTFTMLDSDEAYQYILKKFYEKQERFFWKLFKSENFQKPRE